MLFHITCCYNLPGTQTHKLPTPNVVLDSVFCFLLCFSALYHFLYKYVSFDQSRLNMLGAPGPAGLTGPPVETPKVQRSICQKMGVADGVLRGGIPSPDD